jgi:dTDP-4-amino-4,6-dideoxygalactose transaminase
VRILSRHGITLGWAESLAVLEAVLQGLGYPPALRAGTLAKWNSSDRPRIDADLRYGHDPVALRDPVTLFEQAFARYHGVRHALATGSGRAAVYLALKHLELPAGAWVGIPSHTFFILEAVVNALGFRPVFVPCDPHTYAIDPERLDLSLPDGTAALLVLHPFGQAAPMSAILEICSRRGVAVIEDASQSIGARYRLRMDPGCPSGDASPSCVSRPVGTFGRASAFSFVVGKNMTACGGGMLMTDDDTLASRARLELSSAPVVSDAWNQLASAVARWAFSTRPGFVLGPWIPFLVLNNLHRAGLDSLFLRLNTLDRSRLGSGFEEIPAPFDPARGLFRLNPLQAAFGLAQLERLDRSNDVRRENAQVLLDALRDVPGIELPRVVEGCEPTFNAVAIRVRDARDFRRRLLNLGVDSRESYMRWVEEGRIRRDEVLYLPNHPGLNRDDMAYVARIVRRIAGGKPESSSGSPSLRS